jgi:ATP-dependent DNA helicase RecG
MTATPIPRTLGLTLYGDLDISTIKQMPAGRRPIKTIHRYGRDREKIYAFIQSEIERGRQAYIVYPLIEASEKLNLKDLQEGFEAVKRNFPQQEVAMVHGRLKWQDKNAQMEAFKQLKAQILVATTVIEVGINIPNASVMVIENAERFGLAQLHQLRGRVGRGNDQSYCILLTADNLGQDSKERIKAMVESTDGFYLAEVDMRLRGSGNLMGTQQSGLLRFMIADLQTDAKLLLQARKEAETSLADPHNTKKIAKLHVLCQKLNRFQNQYLSIG